MKKFFAIILAGLLLLTFVSCNKKDGEEEGKNDGALEIEEEIYEDTESGDSFKYAVNDEGTYEITGFISKSDEPHKVEIPDTIDTIEVSGIGADAFKASNYISEVVIPESVTYIGDYAFYGCNYLTGVVMADSVTELGIGSFDSCTALTSVTFSKNIKVISELAFKGCTALAAVTLPEGLEKIEADAFRGCAALAEIVIPDTVKTIGDTAFYGCTALAKATVPAGVETYGEFIFTASKDGFVLVGEEGSWAEKYAADNKYAFEKVGGEAPEEPAE